MFSILVVLSTINRFWLISEGRCLHTDSHGRHICSTTVCWDPEILLTWQRDVTTSLFFRALTGKILVIWIDDRLWEVVAYERWSHRDVRMYIMNLRSDHAHSFLQGPPSFSPAPSPATPCEGTWLTGSPLCILLFEFSYFSFQKFWQIWRLAFMNIFKQKELTKNDQE